MSSAAVQALRGHMVRRLPTAQELSTRSPIVLTGRDREILVGVHLYGFLTTDIVELAFFPQMAKERCSSSSRAYQRLRELWTWGYLSASSSQLRACSAGEGHSCTRWGARASRSSRRALAPWLFPSRSDDLIDSTTCSSTTT
jgi:hypothetical protein